MFRLSKSSLGICVFFIVFMKNDTVIIIKSLKFSDNTVLKSILSDTNITTPGF